MDVLTARGAAKQLRITPNALIALLKDHALVGEQLPDGQWLISSESLRAYRRQTADTGRPWSPTTAWAALAILDGLPALNVSSGTSLQLRQRLRTISPNTLARKLDRRGIIHPYDSPDRNALTGSIIPTGPSAGAFEQTRQADMPQVLYGYLDDPVISIEQFADTHQLTRRIEGNLHLYERPAWVTRDYLGPATIATDLANNSDDGYRQVGLNALANIQDKWIAAQQPIRPKR